MGCSKHDYTMETFLNHNLRLESESPSCFADIAKTVADWLTGEDLCDIDIVNHNFLSENFPLEQAAKRSRIVPNESGSTADSSGSTEGNQPHGRGPGLEPTQEDDDTTARPEVLIYPAVGESLDEGRNVQ